MKWPGAAVMIVLIISVVTFLYLEEKLRLEYDANCKTAQEYSQSLTRYDSSPQKYFNRTSIHVNNIGNLMVLLAESNQTIGSLYAHGASMEPFLGNVTVLYRVPNNFEDVHIGDILVYNATSRKGNLLIMHQVVRESENQYFMKGFNNENEDSYNVTFDKALGIVVGVLY